MPTHKPSLAQLSVSQLSAATGFAKETVTKRLHAAGLEPARMDGRTTWYSTRPALAVLYQPEARRSGNGTGRAGLTKAEELALVVPFGIDGPMPTEPAARLCRLYGWVWPEFAELLGWGLPYTSAGRADSFHGWRITFAHAARYLGLLGGALDLDIGPDFPAELRRLRGAAPLCVPGEFTACRVS